LTLSASNSKRGTNFYRVVQGLTVQAGDVIGKGSPIAITPFNAPHGKITASVASKNLIAPLGIFMQAETEANQSTAMILSRKTSLCLTIG